LFLFIDLKSIFYINNTFISRCQKHLIEVDGSKWREKLPRVPSVKSWEIPEIVDSTGQAMGVRSGQGLGLWCLMPLSTIFQ
jgi:hypothetical protein